MVAATRIAGHSAEVKGAAPTEAIKAVEGLDVEALARATQCRPVSPRSLRAADDDDLRRCQPVALPSKRK